MTDYFYETLQKKDSERCMFIVLLILSPHYFKRLQMVLNEFKLLQLIDLESFQIIWSHLCHEATKLAILYNMQRSLSFFCGVLDTMCLERYQNSECPVSCTSPFPQTKKLVKHEDTCHSARKLIIILLSYYISILFLAMILAILLKTIIFSRICSCNSHIVN